MPSRYREARTLVRRLCRLPGESHVAFKHKCARLRAHFEQFNVDTSELCQWLMGLRKRHGSPSNPASFGVLGDFLLQPSLNGVDLDEKERDRLRLAVFDRVAAFRNSAPLDDQALPEALREAIQAEARARPQPGSKNSTAGRLFERLEKLEPAHSEPQAPARRPSGPAIRLVLLKSAAEWIVARYLRGLENWVRQREEWDKEKRAWEAAHPELTPQIRDRFTNVFKQLRDDEHEGKTGLRRKNPRICSYERLRKNIDNCCYAGQKGHGPLCWRYSEFVRARKAANGRFNQSKFEEDAASYLSHRHAGLKRHEALRRMFPRDPRSSQRFRDNWTAYLEFSRKAVPGGDEGFARLSEQTVLNAQCLPHCLKIGETYEQSKCCWNPHTELCLQYKRALAHPGNGFDDATLALEPLYRAWRRDYLAGPQKPSFRYPSSRELPMPKVFGADYYEVDFEKSVVRLRLDDLRAGEWIEFAFTPWPRDYRPSRSAVHVTSVHVNFIGARARVGFRFDAPHAGKPCWSGRLPNGRVRLPAKNRLSTPHRSRSSAGVGCDCPRKTGFRMTRAGLPAGGRGLTCRSNPSRGHARNRDVLRRTACAAACLPESPARRRCALSGLQEAG
jgi:hypothetical protein